MRMQEIKQPRDLDTIIEMSEEGVSCPVTPSLTNQTPVASQFEVSRGESSDRSFMEHI